MPSFKDSKGRDWSLAMTYAHGREIEDGLGIPVLSKIDEVEFTINNTVQIAWVLVEDQAQARNITPEDFD